MYLFTFTPLFFYLFSITPLFIHLLHLHVQSLVQHSQIVRLSMLRFKQCIELYKCDPHHAKIKYFRSLNGILSKIGTSTVIGVSLSLVSPFATPGLLYGFDTGCLSKTQIDRLNYPFSSIYSKLFNTFDKL